jgi:tetratricopeptide (TPR) repeat protein
VANVSDRVAPARARDTGAVLLGLLYDEMGNYAAAEPLYRRSMEIRRATLGEGHPDYAMSLSNLGLLYHAMGKYAAAVPFLRQAVEISRATLGESPIRADYPNPYFWDAFICQGDPGPLKTMTTRTNARR